MQNETVSRLFEKFREKHKAIQDERRISLLAADGNVVMRFLALLISAAFLAHNNVFQTTIHAMLLLG